MSKSIAAALTAAKGMTAEAIDAIVYDETTFIEPVAETPATIRIDKAYLETNDVPLDELLSQLVDSNMITVVNDLFLVASLIETEFDRIPVYADIVRAAEAATNPDAFAFDKDTVIRSEVEGETMLQGITPQELAARRRDGFKALGGTQWLLLCEVGERALTGISHAKQLQERGYCSQHTKPELWAAATDRAKKRQSSYKDAQELIQRRKAEESALALDSMTKEGGLLDF